jgi:hypothetical protein
MIFLFYPGKPHLVKSHVSREEHAVITYVQIDTGSIEI